MYQRTSRRDRRAALTLGLLLTLGGRVEAQSSVGVASTQPPEEDAYVYKQVPDVPNRAHGS